MYQAKNAWFLHRTCSLFQARQEFGVAKKRRKVKKSTESSRNRMARMHVCVRACVRIGERGKTFRRGFDLSFSVEIRERTLVSILYYRLLLSFIFPSDRRGERGRERKNSVIHVKSLFIFLPSLSRVKLGRDVFIK